MLGSWLLKSPQSDELKKRQAAFDAEKNSNEKDPGFAKKGRWLRTWRYQASFGIPMGIPARIPERIPGWRGIPERIPERIPGEAANKPAYAGDCACCVLLLLAA